MARKLVFIVISLLVLAMAAALLIPRLVDKQKVIDLAADIVREETGANLTLGGDLNLSLFPTVGVDFTDAAITLPGNSEPDVEIESARIGVRLMPLLGGDVKVTALEVQGLTLRTQAAEEAPRVDTSNFTDAQLDTFYQQQREARLAAGEAAGAEAALAVPLALEVSSLKVANAKLESYDPSSGDTGVIVLKTLEAADLNLTGETIPVAAVVEIPGEAPIDVSLEGGLRIDQDSDALDFTGLDIIVRGATAEHIAVNASGSVDIARQSADVKLSLALGETKGDGNLRYASFESPQIDADLKLNLLNPALLALAGPEAAQSNTSSTAPTSGDEPLPLDALRGIDTRASLEIEQAIFGDYTIEQLAVKLRALEGVVTVSQISGLLYDGELDATATFDAKHNVAILNTAGGVSGLNIAAALTALEGDQEVSGRANLDWQLASRGGTANQLTQALSGPITLSTDAVELRGVSVEKLLCQAVAITNQERLTNPFPDTTQFDTLSADVQMQDGQANLQPLVAQLPEIGLTGNGNLDILGGVFKVNLKARLSPELEKLDPACRVSKRLTAIEWPVRCRGALTEAPSSWCSVDTESIIRDLTINEGRRKIEKEAGKLFNKFFDKD
ncbi:MAG: AsmA family protein [Pseudomonadota bacterium]